MIHGISRSANLQLDDGTDRMTSLCAHGYLLRLIPGCVPFVSLPFPHPGTLRTVIFVLDL